MVKDEIKLLKKLVESLGISGAENNIRDILYKELRPYVDEIKTDKIGNLIARKGKGSPVIMIAAHMDQIGLMVKFIDKNGFIRFDTVGSWDEKILPATKVWLHGSKNSLIGVIGSRPIHLEAIGSKENQKKEIKKKDMFIDIGASSKEDVERAGIHIGDNITLYGRFDELVGTRITGQGFDNRIGCYQLVQIAKRVNKFKGTLYLVGTVQEEIGLVGMRGSTYGINPDAVLAVDVGLVGDTPNVTEEECSAKLGSGTIVSFKDAISFINPKIKQWILDSAKKDNLKLQAEVMNVGATDSSVVPMIRAGIPSGAVATPVRYMHTPVETADTRDIENTIKLLCRCIETAKNYF